jgi:hypothetical protein
MKGVGYQNKYIKTNQDQTNLNKKNKPINTLLTVDLSWSI